MLLFCLNIVLSCPFLWSCSYKTLLAHCFWGGYSFAVKPLLKGLFTAYIDTYEDRAVKPHWAKLRKAAEEENPVQLQAAFAPLASAASTRRSPGSTTGPASGAVEDAMHSAVAIHMELELEAPVDHPRPTSTAAFFVSRRRRRSRTARASRSWCRWKRRTATCRASERVKSGRHHAQPSSGVAAALAAAHTYAICGTMSTGLPSSMTVLRGDLP